MGKLAIAMAAVVTTAAMGTGNAVPVAPTNPAAAALVLSGDGIRAGGRTATFARATKAQAIALVSAVLGKPIEAGSHGDCGQGDDIGYAKFRGAFELSFVKGKLSGWAQDSPALATDRGIRVGTTLAALRKAYPDVEADPGDEANGGLGPSFQRDPGPSGWLAGTKPTSRITGLFAGATCLAGV